MKLERYRKQDFIGHIWVASFRVYLVPQVRWERLSRNSVPIVFYWDWLSGQLTSSVLLQMKNVPHRLTHLNIWSPVGGTVWGDGAALQEEVHTGVGLWELISLLTSSSSFCFVLLVKDVILTSFSCTMSNSCCYASHPTTNFYPCGTISQNKFCVPLVAFGSDVLSQQQKNN